MCAAGTRGAAQRQVYMCSEASPSSFLFLQIRAVEIPSVLLTSSSFVHTELPEFCRNA